MSYFRLEHYVPARVLEKLDLSYLKEELPKLHSTYVGASEKETELEFLKVSGQQFSSFICKFKICKFICKFKIGCGNVGAWNLSDSRGKQLWF